MNKNPSVSSDKFIFCNSDENLKDLKIRKVKSTDFNNIYLLTPEIEPLRQYDQYVYKLICDYFSTNSLLLELNNKIVGLAIGFCLPNEPDAFYILQFGVIKDFRSSNFAINFFRKFIQQFHTCSRFYFTMRSANPRRRQILRLIELVTKSPCLLLESIKFSDEEVDYKYEGRYDNKNLSSLSDQIGEINLDY